MIPVAGTGESKTTTHHVVLPFYIYAGISLLVATVFLLCYAPAFLVHHFHPKTLAITHLMALGWGTMIILGASHQLVPVLTESRLFSEKLAFATFILAATGIPLLVLGFFLFDMGWPARRGGELILLAFLLYLLNLGVTISRSKTKSVVHAVFIFAAVLWLVLTSAFGLALVYNFSEPLFPRNSVEFLPLHAHMGVIGWFLLLVIGVGSRLIPMFLVSKYANNRILWLIFYLVNLALVLYIVLFLFSTGGWFYLAPVSLLCSGLALFVLYCYRSYRERIRKRIDAQMRLSLLSVLLMVIPLLILIFVIAMHSMNGMLIDSGIILAYGFVIFFGWITAIILGMTFKTLPFITWNKVYHSRAASGKSPNPKDLFSSALFRLMTLSYISGFILFLAGILSQRIWFLHTGAVLLLLTGIAYNINTIKIILHKPVNNEH